MPEIKHSTCSNCGRAEEIKKSEGIYPDHASGYATLTIGTLPFQSYLLCPSCISFVKKSLRLARELVSTNA
jgi:hypothetical protein